MIKIPAILTFSILLAACGAKEAKPTVPDNAVAYNNDFSISYDELDKVISQELYDQLNQIYLIRKVALDKMIQNKILSLEAAKYKVSTEEYLDTYIVAKQSKDMFDEFVRTNHLEGGISVLRRGVENLSIESEEGKRELKSAFRKYLTEYLVDSLKDAYNITIALQPPPSLPFNFKGIDIQYRGNMSARTSVIIVSDFECDMCQNNAKMYNDLYEKYQDRVKFGFVHFSSRTTLSAMASEAASKQGKFWEMHDKIFDSPILPDTTQLVEFAKELNLDIPKFEADLTNDDLNHTIYKNIMLLNDRGLYGTPTVIIDNRVMFDSSSKASLEDTIDASLELK